MVSGVGSRALAWVLEIPGASRTLLEGTIPYSASSLSNVLGATTEKAVSETTAFSMARTAYKRAVKLRENDTAVIGIGCTGAITTNRERRGINHAFIAIWGARGQTCTHLELEKGLNTPIASTTCQPPRRFSSLAGAGVPTVRLPAGTCGAPAICRPRVRARWEAETGAHIPEHQPLPVAGPGSH